MSIQDALLLKSASREAKLKGCICQSEDEIDIECPVHFPLYYMTILEKFDIEHKKSKKTEKYYMTALIIFVILDILTRLNCM